MIKNRKNIIIYGLQRSGTNFLESILRKNYRVRILNDKKNRSSHLHKHFRIYDSKEIIPEPKYYNKIFVNSFEQFESLFSVVPDFYLIISKDPYSWFLSYKKWSIKCNWPKVDHHYILEYNYFYNVFRKFSSQTNKLIFIRYIDLIKRPKEKMREIEKRINLYKNIFGNILIRIPGNVPLSNTFSVEQRNYYLFEKYLMDINPEEIKKINKLIDSDLLTFLGYEKKINYNY